MDAPGHVGEAHDRFDSAEIVLLSDHAHRSFTHDDLRRIPLIVKRPGQREPRQHFEAIGSEALLARIVEGAD